MPTQGIRRTVRQCPRLGLQAPQIHWLRIGQESLVGQHVFDHQPWQVLAVPGGPEHEPLGFPAIAVERVAVIRVLCQPGGYRFVIVPGCRQPRPGKRLVSRGLGGEGQGGGQSHCCPPAFSIRTAALASSRECGYCR
ncbi:MAG: hypothetical protein AW07_03455 [Candidatus Accumulibacter sp. SK-11]|nr:MAG: hypothetical protein AW07_03455 [Candidatus Accumulibacter sp. SK-11]